MELQTLLETRRSVREYNADRKVTKEDITAMIKAAQLAPSWKNRQTSRYHIVMDEKALSAFRVACLPSFNAKNAAGASALIVTTFVKDIVGFNEETHEPMNEAENGWGYYDLGLQNMALLLKAKEMGLSTLVMGIRHSEKIRSLLSIPENELIASVIAVGYSDAEPEVRPRKAVDEIVKFY